MSHTQFTKEKFVSLPLSRRHKKAAETLRFLFEEHALGKDIFTLCQAYHLMEEWLELPIVDLTSSDLIDRYHFHLLEAGLQLKEHNLLQVSTHFDKESKVPYLPITIYLDRLRSAANVGNILRTIEALRLGRVVFSQSTPFTDNTKVQKCSMGTFPLLDCSQAELPTDLPIIALETATHSESLFTFTFPKAFTLILGNEEYGVHPDYLKKADHIVSIPLVGMKNSLNVSVAFGICAFEISRQLR